MLELQQRMRQRLVALAPVASVTDSVYRRICKRFGADYVVTELVSSEGLNRDSLRSYELARFTESERPVGVQIFGGDPDTMARAAELVNELSPDAIDINMGCPARKVVRHAGGSDLLRDLPRLARVVQAVVRHAAVPVSVKIRAGWDDTSINAVEAARIIEAEGAQWLTVHPRTRQQGFSGAARWEIIRDVKRAVGIPVIGNGDIATAGDALRMFARTGCDSVMIGRGSFGYPWLFAQIKALLAGDTPRVPSARQRVEMALEHLRAALAEASVDPVLVVRKMRKHLAWYIGDLPGSKELRVQIFSADTYEQVAAVLERFAALEAPGSHAAQAGDAAAAALLSPAAAHVSPSFDRLGCDELSCDPASLEPSGAGGPGEVPHVRG